MNNIDIEHHTPIFYSGISDAVLHGQYHKFLYWNEIYKQKYGQSIQDDFLTVQFNNELLRHFIKKLYIELIQKNDIDLLRENLTWVTVDEAFMFRLLKEATFFNKPDIVTLLLTDPQLAIHAPIYFDNDSIIPSCIANRHFDIFHLLLETLALTNLAEIQQYKLNLLMMILEYHQENVYNPFLQYMFDHPEYEINADVYEYLAYFNTHPKISSIFMCNAIRNNIDITEFHLGEKGNIKWALSQEETDIPVKMMLFLKKHDYFQYIEHLGDFYHYCHKNDMVHEYEWVFNHNISSEVIKDCDILL